MRTMLPYTERSERIGPRGSALRLCRLLFARSLSKGSAFVGLLRLGRVSVGLARKRACSGFDSRRPPLQ